MATLIHILVRIGCGCECLVAMPGSSAQNGRVVMFAPSGLINNNAIFAAHSKSFSGQSAASSNVVWFLGVGGPFGGVPG